MTLGLDVQIKTDLATEPVTLLEAKTYLNVDYSSWDTLITTLISSARTKLERYTGCTFATKTLVSTFQQVSDNIDIPYGPIQSITHIKSIDESGTKTTLTAGTDYVITGNTYKNVRFFGISTPIEIEYVAGYTSLPADLKVAIMKQVGMDFEYRENIIEVGSITELSNGAKQFAKSYRRVSLF
jgi:uncharacterized phiE125 gp8 family phage protein